MAVPKQRHTKSRRNNRRLNLFIKSPALSICTRCKSATQPHAVCGNCGYYKGVEVIDLMKKLTKKEAKEKQKKIMEEKDKKTKPMTMEGLSKKN